MRHESRGLHYSRDFPTTLPVSFPTVLVRPARSRRGSRVAGRMAAATPPTGLCG
jgi:L-aspartate oxidase